MVSGGCFRGWAGDPIPAAGYESVSFHIAWNAMANNMTMWVGQTWDCEKWLRENWKNPQMISSSIFGESFSICKLSGCHLGLSKIRHRYPQILYFTHPSCRLGAPYVWRKPFGDRYACLIKLFKDMIASGFTVRYGKIIIYTRYVNCDCNLLEGIPMTIPYAIPIKSPLLMVKSQAMLVQQQFMLVKSVI